MRTLVKLQLIWIVLLATGTSFGQSPTLGQDRSPKKPIVDKPGDAPISKAELAATMLKVNKVLDTLVFQKQQTTKQLQLAPGVASRADVIASFYAVFKKCKPKFRYTPIPALYEPGIVTIPSDHVAGRQAKSLIEWGFIGRFDPIVTSKSVGLHPAEYGFALGQFLNRLGELVHMPSSKFSPAMMRDD